ncbi:hypothetical protein QJS10_CPA03g01804 [Acorus calamus]|uniref:LisH domain-containing protein n=1 Tax=Acorus calamus TaxID=4465 RepID=A0AAV9F4M3_ACOCL|nr:hypothetical protein QJS10_CPA03g01804 [Acorus calamus]
MAKQSKSKRAANIGTGKVTQVQVAFIVEQYLIDNNFTKTLSVFRAEASLLIPRTKNKEAPKGLLGLGDILDEYICLKEQKVSHLESLIFVGVKFQLQPKSTTSEETFEDCSIVDPETLSHPISRHSRQGSTVVKSLFKEPMPPNNSSSPKTPPSLKFTRQADKSVTPLDTLPSFPEPTNCRNTQVINTSNCSIKSSETIIVSPFKRMGYYSVEKSYCISSPSKSNLSRPCKRDHVKGRLDFENSDVSSSSGESIVLETSTPPTDAEMQEIFDIDIPNLDVLSELLAEFDVPSYSNYGEMVCPLEPVLNSFGDINQGSGSQCFTSHDTSIGSRLASITQMLSEDINIQGPDSVKSMKTITKRIQIISPGKHTYHVKPSLLCDSIDIKHFYKFQFFADTLPI